MNRPVYRPGAMAHPPQPVAGQMPWYGLAAPPQQPPSAAVYALPGVTSPFAAAPQAAPQPVPRQHPAAALDRFALPSGPDPAPTPQLGTSEWREMAAKYAPQPTGASAVAMNTTEVQGYRAPAGGGGGGESPGEAAAYRAPGSAYTPPPTEPNRGPSSYDPNPPPSEPNRGPTSAYTPAVQPREPAYFDSGPAATDARRYAGGGGAQPGLGIVGDRANGDMSHAEGVLFTGGEAVIPHDQLMQMLGANGGVPRYADGAVPPGYHVVGGQLVKDGSDGYMAPSYPAGPGTPSGPVAGAPGSGGTNDPSSPYYTGGGQAPGGGGGAPSAAAGAPGASGGNATLNQIEVSGKNIYQLQTGADGKPVYVNIGTTDDIAGAAAKAGIPPDLLQREVTTQQYAAQQRSGTLNQISVAGGKIYQLKTGADGKPGYVQIGTTADIDGAAAAAGVDPALMRNEVQAQQYTQDARSYNSKQVQYNSTNQDADNALRDKNRTLDAANADYATAHLSEDQKLRDQNRIYDSTQRTYDLATDKAYTGGKTVQQYNLDTQDHRNEFNSEDARYALEHQGADEHLRDSNRTYDQSNRDWQLGSASFTNGDSRQKYEQDTADIRSPYNRIQAEYDSKNQSADNYLRDLQRDFYTGDTRFKLKQQPQQQKVDATKLNQTDYEQMQGMRSRELAGYGYAAMKIPQTLAGQ